MSPKRQLRVCKACKGGTCSECTNWLNKSDWCEHNCAQEPKQLGLFPTHFGRALADAMQAPATEMPPAPPVREADDEPPW